MIMTVQEMSCIVNAIVNSLENEDLLQAKYDARKLRNFLQNAEIAQMLITKDNR